MNCCGETDGFGKIIFMKNKIEILESPEAVSREAAKRFIHIGNRAIKKHDRFTVALAGGSTPKLLYQMLAGDPYRSELDWSRVFFFFGDERDVSPQSVKSNYRMALELLLEPLDILKENIFRWPTEIINVDEVAKNYRQTLKRFFKLSNGEFPIFDLILLGMGVDGHTASLFPYTEALHERHRTAVANYVEKFDQNRLTLTYPTINHAANVIFLVTGKNKGSMLKQVFETEPNCERLPSQCVKPVSGSLIWLTDRAAAAQLN